MLLLVRLLLLVGEDIPVLVLVGVVAFDPLLLDGVDLPIWAESFILVVGRHDVIGVISLFTTDLKHILDPWWLGLWQRRVVR